MRKSQLLKWAGVLMMPASLLRFFFGLFMFNVFTTSLSFGTLEKEDLRLPGAALVLIVLSTLAGLVTGFLGVLNWEEPLRAGRCAVWGAVTLGLSLLGCMMQLLAGYGVSYVIWITAILIPLFFFIAALRFRLKRKTYM
jgi:hypothetical protein